MLTEEMKNSLFEANSNYPIVINEDLGLEDWIAAGRPRCIIEVERKDGFVAAIDVAYGLMMLFNENGKFFGAGRYDVVINDVVLLDKAYHGCSKYLWF